MLIDPADFLAVDYAASKPRDDRTADDLRDALSREARERIDEVEARIESLVETIDLFKTNGDYSAERLDVHQTIAASFFSSERTEAAKPEGGRRPRFILLGGRGGSGKSWFRNRAFNADRFLVIDPDAIKAMLPGYEGWNAFAYHEESSDLTELVLWTARALGLNVVLDVTMRSQAGVREKLDAFAATHDVSIHYMFLPAPEAAARAIDRFLKPGGRYVPIEVVFQNMTNEATFDAVAPDAEIWSFHDNDVPRGDDPQLVSAKDWNETDLIPVPGGLGKDDA